MENLARWLIVLGLWLAAAPALAQEAAAPSDRDLAYEDRIAELERTVTVLAEELERTRMDMTVPEEPELKSYYGLGPAASKVYDITRGLSIGGYGEMFYRHHVTNETTAVNAQTGATALARQNDTADFLRAIIYVGYKFTDNIIFNSEIEIEHADEIFLEFATLDFLLNDFVNIKTGLMLMPVGFLNEYHEPPFFYGVNRPDVETFLIPSTWRENGVGIFGSLGETFTYKLYGVNGLNGAGFSTAGIRGGRQKGSQTLAEDLAFVGRFDWTPFEGSQIGASFYMGNSGQDQNGPSGALPDATTKLFEVHAQQRWRGLHFRSLFAMVFVDDAGQLSTALANPANGPVPPVHSIAETMMGGYGEIAYNIWPWIARFFGGEGERSLEPFYRFEYYDTQWEVPSGFARDRSKEVFSHTVGFSFEPIPNVVIKTDYRNRQPRRGSIADEVNFGIGYVF